MSKAEPRLLFSVGRALEHAVGQAGVRPVRVYRYCLPLYVAEISATVESREPFDLIDRYVSLAISEGSFHSVTAIASFLGMTEHIVGHAVAFMSRIGHLAGEDGALALTEPGARAAAEDTRYTVRKDRLKLYFDAVRGDPLPVAYYRKGVHVLTAEEAVSQPRFKRLASRCDFRTEALDELGRCPDRQAYNLPDEHRDLEVVAVEAAFLPCYLIRARSGSGYRTLVYTGTDDRSDDVYAGRLVADWPGIEESLRREDEAAARDDRREELGRWLADRSLSWDRLTWQDGEIPRLTLAARHFPTEDAPSKARGTFSPNLLGSYITPHSHVLQLWCADPVMRRQTALARAFEYANATRRDPEDISRFLARLSTQLELAPVLEGADLRRYATRRGHSDLI